MSTPSKRRPYAPVVGAAALALVILLLGVHPIIALAAFALICLASTALLERRLRLQDAALRGLAQTLTGVRPALIHHERREEVDAARRALAEIAREAPEHAPIVRAIEALLTQNVALSEAVGAEAQLRQALLTAIGDPIVATDNTGAILFANAAAAQLFDADADALVGAPFSAHATSAYLLTLEEQGRSGWRRSEQVSAPIAGELRSFAALATPLEIPSLPAPGALLSLRDVTELTQAVTVKADFVANASHELRTPLAAIKGAVETLETALTEDPDAAQRFVRIIAAHVRRLEELSRDLLDLSRIESDEQPTRAEPLDVGKLVDSLAVTFQGISKEKNIRLDFDIDPSLAGFVTDPRLLALILQNLVENAVKFSREGSPVCVAGKRERDIARFEVADKGVGVPLSAQKRVFERFYQVEASRAPLDSSSTRGSGLGLAIVRHAARKLGGEATLESVLNEGTTVRIEIPRLDPHAPHGQEGAPERADHRPAAG